MLMKFRCILIIYYILLNFKNNKSHIYKSYIQMNRSLNGFNNHQKILNNWLI
mgnify:CR=1 FL=1|jgi:hypothetical protein